MIKDGHKLRGPNEFLKDIILKAVDDLKRLYPAEKISSKCDEFQKEFWGKKTE